SDPPVVIYVDAVLTGSDVQSAIPDAGVAGGPAVSLKFNSSGAARLARATSSNVERKVAVVVDNQIIAAPVIRDPITNGEATIRSPGVGGAGGARLAAIISVASLRVPLRVIEEIVIR